MSNEWQHGLCGCFDDCGICILTVCVPCYTFGKAAEATGSSCCLCGCLLLTPASIIVVPLIRRDMRNLQNISGSIIGDCCLSWCFTCCVITQMAMEAKTMQPRALDVERE